MEINKFFKTFWIIYLLEFLTPFLLFIFYLTGIDMVFLFKLPQLFYLFLIGIFHFQKPLLKSPFIILFSLFGVFSLIYGLFINSKIDSRLFSHIYYNIIPILGVSFGLYFAKYYNEELKVYLNKIINISYWITILILLIYFYLHFVSAQIPYWGFGTDMHMLIPFLLTQNKYILVILGFIFVFLSGKRATTLNVAVVAIMFFWTKIFSFNIKKVFISGVILIVMIFTIKSTYDQGYLSRFEDTINFDTDDEYSMTVATSGRWQEITGIIDFLNAKQYRWYIGAGFGGTYLWDASIVDVYEWKHYAHFSPFTYLFIYGLPFTILLYGTLFFLMIKGFKYVGNHFYILFVVLIFGSFFGANLLIDIKIWFFIGIACHLILSKNINQFLLK
jgi:hypothetical protein